MLIKTLMNSGFQHKYSQHAAAMKTVYVLPYQVQNPNHIHTTLPRAGDSLRSVPKIIILFNPYAYFGKAVE